MTTTKKFVLDANVFIQAHKEYYRFSVCPGFWQSLEWWQERGVIISVGQVKDELANNKDALRDWAMAKARSQLWAKTDDADAIAAFGELAQWVQRQAQFRDTARAEFNAKADGWVIAYAKSKGYVVVTHEVPNPDIKKKVPIPNVCQAFGVEYVNTFEMLQALGVRFEWAAPS